MAFDGEAAAGLPHVQLQNEGFIACCRSAALFFCTGLLVASTGLKQASRRDRVLLQLALAGGIKCCARRTVLATPAVIGHIRMFLWQASMIGSHARECVPFQICLQGCKCPS